MKTASTVDRQEVERFEALGESWWDEKGAMRPLHKLNPVRLGYIRDAVCRQMRRDSSVVRPLKGLTLADIGCGGGLVAEPLCRMGAAVTGIDAGEENIKVAHTHARRHGLEIDYKATTVEALAHTGKTFDVVTALEIVEHVANPDLFIASCCKILKKDGVLVMSTLNRTAKSFALGIVAAEYIMRWLPAGTHDWKKFMKPSEMAQAMEENDCAVIDAQGLVYNPLTSAFSLSKSDLAVNYLMTAVKL